MVNNLFLLDGDIILKCLIEQDTGFRVLWDELLEKDINCAVTRSDWNKVKEQIKKRSNGSKIINLLRRKLEIYSLELHGEPILIVTSRPEKFSSEFPSILTCSINRAISRLSSINKLSVKASAKSLPNTITAELPPKKYSVGDVELEKFNLAYEKLLNFEEADAKSMSSYLKRIIKQFNLQGSYSEMDIHAEVYCRSFSLLKRDGISIRNPSAWIKKLAYNIIREWSRKEKNYINTNSDYSENFTVYEKDLERELRAITSSLNFLSSEEVKLLELRIVEEMSWATIHKVLKAGGEEVSKAALRKRYQIILNRIRNRYCSLGAENSFALPNAESILGSN